MKKSTWFWSLILTNLLSLGFHYYLTSQHYKVKLGLSEGPSFCNISANFNCDAVAASSYSHIGDVPLALFGFMIHAVFLILLISAQMNLSEHSGAIKRLLFPLASLIALVSVVMGLISVTQLGTYCLFCIVTYILSFIALFAAWKIQDENPLTQTGSDIAALFSKLRWVLILLVLVPAAAWLASNIIMDNYGFSRLKQMVQEEIAIWQSAPAQNFSEKGLVKYSGEISNSDPKKIVTIVEFADFLCPHCKSAATSLDAFINNHPNVKLVFKTFPLDGKCNKGMQHQGDGVRCQLAAAAVCGEQMNQSGWKAHHWIFENQEKFFAGYSLDTAMKDLAGHLGVNSDEWNKCLQSDSTFEYVQSMAAEGMAAKIQGTPSIFLNGKRLQKGQFLPVLQKVFEQVQ